MKRLPTILALTFIVGCVTPRFMNNPLDVLSIARDTTIERNEFDGSTRITGPRISRSRAPTYFLRSFILPEDQVHQLYISTVFAEWAFLDRAYRNGEALDITEIDREVGTCSSFGCNVIEDVAINLTIAELREYAEMEATYAAEIQGNQGSVVVTVPSQYFKGYLEVLAQHAVP